MRVLRAQWRRTGAAGERAGAVHRRCQSGDAGLKPVDSHASRLWACAAPAVVDQSCEVTKMPTKHICGR